MWLRELELVDFRSYEHAVLHAEPGALVFLGSNGQGKTNLVEAILYAAGLDSHRVHTDAALVRAGAPRAVVRVEVVTGQRAVRVEVELNPGAANRARVNGQPVTRMRDVVGNVRCCLFAPEHLRLVKGDPSDRRRFLDGIMVQVAPRYLAVRSDFERALKQRNAALRSLVTAPTAEAEAVLAAWDDRYVPVATELTWGRLNAVRQLARWVEGAYGAISPAQEPVTLTYEAAAGPTGECGTREDLGSLLAAALRDAHRDEVRRGVTLVGPHRDDLGIALAGRTAKLFASHGEAWSLALSLQLASFHVLRDIADDPPILVLDDVFAELDVVRRERLLNAITGAEQVLVTAAVDADVPQSLDARRVLVAKDDWSRLDAPSPVSDSPPDRASKV